MWTPRALASEARPSAFSPWRMVESQWLVATLKLVDTLDEQAILEQAIEHSKPEIPQAARHLPPLLAAPFRYVPYPHGSRFRQAHQRAGCLYAAEVSETAAIEYAFYRVLFFAASPGTSLPQNPMEASAFQLLCGATPALDLTLPPFAADAPLWLHRTDYAASQDFADIAREAGVGAIRYPSVRDPRKRANLAILRPHPLRLAEPPPFETWRVYLRPTAVQLVRERPYLPVELPLSAWSFDPRIPAELAAINV